jgi:tetratricopeptide (TPR) repeat protein
MRYPPKLPGGMKVPALVSLADVMPTALDLLEVDYAGEFGGVNLADLASGSASETGKASETGNVSARGNAAAEVNDTGERRIYLESLYPNIAYGWSELKGVRNERYKYIRLPTPELYDVIEDPDEQRNIASEREDLVAALEGWLEQRASGGSESLAEDAALSAADRERLTALGYLSAGVPEQRQASLKDPKEMIRYHELMALGQQAIQAGEYAEAEEYLQQVVRGDPENAFARSIMGMILYQEGNIARSREELEKAIELNPKNLSDAHYNLGIVLSSLGQNAEAAASYERALEIDPTRGDYCMALARTYAKMGEGEKAAALYGRSIELGYDSLRAYLGRGSTLAKLHRFDEAEACYREALEKFPGSPDVYNEYGNMKDLALNFPEAITQYRKALAVEPAHIKARFNLARVLAKTGKQDEAQTELLRIVESDPDQPEATWMLGELAFSRGDNEEAREYFTRYLALEPKNEEARAQARARLEELR